MGIQKTENTESQEALVFDRVFMDRLSITQDLIANDADSPKYKVEVTYRMYALDSNGDMFFKNVPVSLTLPDFYTTAITEAGGGDNTYVAGLQAVEAVIAKMITDQQSTATQVV